MTTTRVYAPADAPTLAGLLETGAFPASFLAFAVTPAVRAAFPDDDEEDLEYAALWAAAQTGRRAAGADERVVVVAADANDVEPAPGAADAPDDEAYVVRVGEALPVGRVVSLHVAEPDDREDEELAWYDASELADVVSAGRLS